MALAPDDLIVAPATPPGRGALALVRASGSGALALVSALGGRGDMPPRRATRVRLSLLGGLDEDALVTTFVAPHSFTGQDSVEFSVHGSPVIVEALLAACLERGARLAGPGEFTHRAFLNQRLDLLQAEAVADLVAATTVAQARVASAHLEGTLSQAVVALGDDLAALRLLLEASLDFPDEGFHFIEPADVVARLDLVRGECERLLASATAGQRLHDGALVVIAGRPNAGKSSLFNALLGRPRAIVTPIAGTTRDLLMETIDVGGVPVRLVDSAGLRASADPIEREGVARAEETMAAADVVIFVVDGTADGAEQEHARGAWTSVGDGRGRLMAISKADTWEGRVAAPEWCPPEALPVSAVSGAGLEALMGALAGTLGMVTAEGAVLTRARHRSLVAGCREAVARARATTAAGGSEEYVLADVQEALEALALLRGVETPDEVLQSIFSSFCIGK